METREFLAALEGGVIETTGAKSRVFFSAEGPMTKQLPRRAFGRVEAMVTILENGRCASERGSP